MRRTILNLALGAFLLAISVVAEISNSINDAAGFEVLLYQPFEFAFALLAVALFVGLNVYLSRKSRNIAFGGVGAGLVIAIGWFMLAFGVVAQLHISLGGKL
jgi:hypothetical protein